MLQVGEPTPFVKNENAGIVAVSRRGRADLVARLAEGLPWETGDVGAVMRSIIQEIAPGEHCTSVEAGIVRLGQAVESWCAETACLEQGACASDEGLRENGVQAGAGIPDSGMMQLMQAVEASAAGEPRAEQAPAQTVLQRSSEALTLTLRQALSSEILLEVEVRRSDKVMCLHEAIFKETASPVAAFHMVFRDAVLDPWATIAEAGLAHGDTVSVMRGSLRCLTASSDGTMRLWQLRSGDGSQEQTLLEPAGPVLTHSLSACKTRLLTIACDGEGEIWCTKTGTRLCLLNGVALTGEFSPDGQWIVGTSGDDEVRVWCARTGNCERVLKGHADDITSASFSPDGRSIVTASCDATARIWTADTGERVHSLTGHTDTVKSAVFSPDGQLVITASVDATARVWSVASGECLQVLKGHAKAVSSASFSPTMNQMITASFDHTVKVWRAESGECLFTEPSLDPATFSPDGRTVLIASGSEDLRLVDALSGNLLHTLSGHEEWVRAASFSSDGLLIMSASYDGTVRLWSTAIGKCVQTLKVHQGGAVFASEFVN